MRSSTPTRPIGRLRRVAPTFAEYAQDWLEFQVDLARAGVIRTNTLTRFESALHAHLVPFFGGYRVGEITRADCDRFRATLFQAQQLAPRTINGVIEVLRLVLRRAIQDGKRHGPDPTTGMRPLLAPVRHVDCYSGAEVRTLLGATPPRYRAIVALAVLAGLRQGEIHALQVSDVDASRQVVSVRRSLQRPHRLLTLDQRLGPPKTPASIRTVPLRPAAAKLLSQHLHSYHRANPLNLVFPGKRGQPLEPSNLRRRVYLPAIQRAGLRMISFHDLRVTFITQCAEAGIPLVVIARWVGHTTTKTTEIYLHSTRSTELRALELLRIYDETDASTAHHPRS